MPIGITLPNGRHVDVETKAGANYFISYGGPESFSFFSTNLKRCDQIYRSISQRSSRRPDQNEINELTVVYGVAAGLAQNADPDIFAQIPEGELKLYLEHLTKRFRFHTKDPNWVNKGTVMTHLDDQVMMNSTVEIFRHTVPVKLAHQRNFFETLAEFAAAATTTVDDDDAETMTMAVANSVITTLDQSPELPSTDRAFKKLEASGMLEQFIRLSTCKPMSSSRGVLKFYDELIKRTKLIIKWFGSESPCGKVAKKIVSDSTYRNHAVTPKLRTILAFSNQEVCPEIEVRMCRHCDKNDPSAEFQQALMKCSRCKSTYYCSKECQRADWKRHKKSCIPVSSSQARANLFTENTVQRTIWKNYVPIMKEIVASGLPKREILLEMDFATPPQRGGLAPALRDPGEFKIAPARGYFEGDRPDEPDWFYKGQDRACYESNVRAIVPVLKDTFERLQDQHLLAFVRSPSGGGGCYRITLQSEETMNPLFGQQTVDACRKAIEDEDFSDLMDIVGVNTPASQSMLRVLRRGFGAMPGDDDLNAVREMLNRCYGASFDLGER